MGPEERFFLVAETAAELEILIHKTAKIGYEQLIQGAVVRPAGMTATGTFFDLAAFKANPGNYTLVDIRNRDEQANSPIFEGALNIPLPELRERAHEIPQYKPVLIHCAGGYRSAAGVSIVANEVKQVPVLDFSEAIKDFETAGH